MLKRRKESDTYLDTFCRHRWSAQMTMKKITYWSFHQLMKTTVVAET